MQDYWVQELQHQCFGSGGLQVHTVPEIIVVLASLFHYSSHCWSCDIQIAIVGNKSDLVDKRVSETIILLVCMSKETTDVCIVYSFALFQIYIWSNSKCRSRKGSSWRRTLERVSHEEGGVHWMISVDIFFSSVCIYANMLVLTAISLLNLLYIDVRYSFASILPLFFSFFIHISFICSQPSTRPRPRAVPASTSCSSR